MSSYAPPEKASHGKSSGDKTLKVGSVHDSAEREAERIATLLTSPAAPALPVCAACGAGGTPCPACSGRGYPILRRRLAQDGEGTQGGEMAAPASLGRALSGPGERLPDALRQRFERRLGVELGGVRLHTGPAAARASRAIQADSFAAGQDIAFAAGKYQPDTREGRSLIAHEVAHTMQSKRIARRKPTSSSTQPQGSGPAQARGGVSVSITGLHFTPPAGSTYEAGPRLTQILDLLLTTLVGSQKASDDAAALAAELESIPGGLLNRGFVGLAEAGESTISLHLDPEVALGVVSWCQSRGYGVELSAERIDTLSGGVVALTAWRYIQTEEFRSNVGTLPPWFSVSVFVQEMSYRRALLTRAAAAILRHQREPTPGTHREVLGALSDTYDALYGGVFLLERIEADTSLKTEDGYVLLFGTQGRDSTGQDAARSQQPADGQAPDATPPAGETAPEASTGPSDVEIATFLRFAASQGQLVAQASQHEGSGERRELLARFVRYRLRTAPTRQDALLTDAASRANAPPHPATLSVYPPLQAPYFDAALGTPHAFSMRLSFPDVFAAFARYAYEFNYVEVSPTTVRSRGLASADALPTGTTTDTDVAAAAFAQAGRYALEDVAGTISNIRGVLDVAPGIAALNLVAANAVLRFISTGIRTLLETVTEPSYQQRLIFPKPGLYLIRASALPILAGDEEIVRAPSVAWMPLFARSPEDMSERRARALQTGEDAKRRRIAEIESLLAVPMSRPNEPELRQELARLRAETGGAADRIAFQIAEIEGQLASSPSPQHQQALQRSLDNLKTIAGMQSSRAQGRPKDRASTLTGSFVSDQGQTIALLLETWQVAQGARQETWYVSDLTTPKSGDDRGVGKDKSEAVMNALVTIFSGIEGYGRGWCSVVIDGKPHRRRISASEGALMMEALEGLTMVASLAAVAAAPFTGGSSLYLLVPIGLIGAVPSAYRLATRAESGTLRMDFESAMDLLNIVGGVVGAAQIGVGARAASLAGRGIAAGRALRIANGGLLVMGLGSDGLGVIMLAGWLVHQIEQTKDLPPGLRAARIAETLGGAMLNAGIMVGGALMSKRLHGDIETQMRAATDAKAARLIALQSKTILGDHHLGIAYRDGKPFIKVCSPTCFELVSALRAIRHDPSFHPHLQPTDRHPIMELLYKAEGLLQRVHAGDDPTRLQPRIDALADDLRSLLGNNQALSNHFFASLQHLHGRLQGEHLVVDRYRVDQIDATTEQAMRAAEAHWEVLHQALLAGIVDPSTGGQVYVAITRDIGTSGYIRALSSQEIRFIRDHGFIEAGRDFTDAGTGARTGHAGSTIYVRYIGTDAEGVFIPGRWGSGTMTSRRVPATELEVFVPNIPRALDAAGVTYQLSQDGTLILQRSSD